MFGRINDEETDYIREYSCMDDSSERLAAEQFSKSTNTEYLRNMFHPCLRKGEKLLCVIGSGKGNYDDSKVKRIACYIIIIGLISTIIGMLLGILFDFISDTAIFALMFLGFFVIPIIGGLIIILYAIFNVQTGNYAITDKRVLMCANGIFKYYPLTDFVKTSFTVNSKNKGSVIMSSEVYDGRNIQHVLIIPNVYNPARVKHIADEAIQRLRMTEFHG